MSKTEETSTKFTGRVAEVYDNKRDDNLIWRQEYELIVKQLHRYPQGTHVFDVGIGTGRFIPFYEEKGFKVLGLDISNDMLCQAKKKVQYPQRNNIYLAHGDVLNLKSSSVYENLDVIICTRLISLLDASDAIKLMTLFKDLNAGKVILTNRDPITGQNEHKYTCTRELITDGWLRVSVQRIFKSQFYMYILSNGGNNVSY